MRQLTPQQQGVLQALTSRVNILDDLINKVSGAFNFNQIKTGSIMITGIDARLKDASLLITWTPGASGPLVPTTCLRKFFECYAQDLIAERSIYIANIERLTVEDPDQVDVPALKPLPGTVHRRQCITCNEVTAQQYGIYHNEKLQNDAPAFLCLTCETVQP